VIVYTAVFGKTDPLQIPTVRGECEYRCYTDQDITSDFWEIIRVEKKEEPARASRILKAHPGFEVPHLWIDANFILRVDPIEILDAHPEELVNFNHRDRVRITDEAKEIVRLRKSPQDDVLRQLLAYKAEGFDVDNNPMRSLSCNGMNLKRPTERVRAFSSLLARQLGMYSDRDQMAWDYCVWKTGAVLGKFPGTFDNNPYTRYVF